MKAKSLTASLMLGALLAFPFQGEARQMNKTQEKNIPQTQLQHTAKGVKVYSRQVKPAYVGEASAKKMEHPIPFHGTIGSIDKSGHSFTLESKTGAGRTLNITGRTNLTHQGNPANFGALSKGEMVRGSYWKLPNGSLEAKSVKVGPMTVAEKEAAKEHLKARAAKKASSLQEQAKKGNL